MASNVFLFWDIDRKIQMFEGLSNAILTGAVTRVSTARGVETEFDGTTADARKNLQDLVDAIACDDSVSQLDPSGALRQKCKAARRSFNTKPIFC